LEKAFESWTPWRVRGCELSVRWRRETSKGRWVLAVDSGWPARPSRRALALGEVFVIWKTGQVRGGRGPELARWKLAMLVNLGFLQRSPLRLRQLPEGTPLPAVATWDAVHELLSERRLTEPPGTPFAFSAPWAAARFGLAEKDVRAGKRLLENLGFLVRAGEA